MGRRAEAALTALLVIGAMAALACHCAFLRVPLVDDAAISLAYGLSLFHGDGFRLTHSSQVIEAFSSPLWTILLGFSVPLRADPIRFASALASVLGVLALPAFAAWGSISERRLPRLEDAAGAWLCATCTSYAYWSASGMETGLFALLLGAGGAALLRGLHTGRFTLPGALLGLACLTRPEGVLYAFAAAAVWLFSRTPVPSPRSPRLQERSSEMEGRSEAILRHRLNPGELRGLAAFAAITLGYEVFRLAYFADLLPNTYYAKSTQDFGILRYLGGFADAYLPLVIASALGLVGAIVLSTGTRRAGWLALGFVASGVAFVVRFKGDWMREWRFLAPIVPALTAGVSLGLGALRSRLSARVSAPILATGTLLVAGVASAAQWPIVRDRAPLLQRGPELPMEQIAGIARSLKTHVDWVGMRRPLIAFPDIGGLGLTLPESEVLDTGILADYAIGRHRQNYPAAEDYLTSEGMPAYIDMHGPSGYVEHYRKLMSHFAPAWQLAPGAHLPGFVWILKGLTPTSDPRCPGSRAEVTSLSREQLQNRLTTLFDANKPVAALQLWRCAFTYQPDEALPTRAWRDALADRAQERALARADASDLWLALRFQSLSAVLDNGSPQRRRLAEKYRSALFPMPRQ